MQCDDGASIIHCFSKSYGEIGYPTNNFDFPLLSGGHSLFSVHSYISLQRCVERVYLLVIIDILSIYLLSLNEYRTGV